ncbi:amino acid carrier protein [Oceanococcus atlanticus]|uniref:Amino acid carrier protein n=2 Tax=Oceanococcus atlanticus TaxID=1317117 RepID=A0A1Y1SFX5_9GAMM|nr:amino acid carrier protein [Oceanococcus atlanticus]RZO87166.1 MAG: alanine:cation symporter family protein [Oceanococcus sp.]
MQTFMDTLNVINGVMLSVPVLLALLGVGVLFTFWSGFCQYRSLTHGVGLISGRWDSKKGPGAISHFQALSAALSATVGLGNIAGVAIAVELGGPGAVFWMWMVGLAGMALKTTEVTLSMLYRNTDNPSNPNGGPMWVARSGLREAFPGIGKLASLIGALFCLPLILFALTGGNMFQAWSVAETTRSYFGVPTWVSGLVMAVLVGLVILGGIKRIGRFAGTLVPLMCGIYVLCGLFVIGKNADMLPDIVRLIFTSAFSPAEASGAFVGAGVGTAFIFGMKRALFSSEAGLGSAPIAHSAVKTKEPVTEGVVGGLEPFIDTLVVCTLTAFVILSSGVWQRGPAGEWPATPSTVQSDKGWAPAIDSAPPGPWSDGDTVFVVATLTQDDGSTARHRLFGQIEGDSGNLSIRWKPLSSAAQPQLVDAGLYENLPASTLTARAFDSGFDGLGRWMVTITIWLFAISTMITWSYYGEQGMIYLSGQRLIVPFRVVWCGLIVVTCLGFIRTAAEIDTISTVAIGFMLAINVPVMVVLGSKAMRAYKDYFRRLDSGDIKEV